jgi:WxcM-like, C-terminal
VVAALDDCRRIEFPVIPNPAGNLAVVEEDRGGLPFPIRRVYYLYAVPRGARRGGHAHRNEEQVLIAVAGRLNVVVDDGAARRSVTLDTPHVGLYVPTMIWRELTDFSSGAVCLVLSSSLYDASDYVRDYDEFVALRTP